MIQMIRGYLAAEATILILSLILDLHLTILEPVILLTLVMTLISAEVEEILEAVDQAEIGNDKNSEMHV